MTTYKKVIAAIAIIIIILGAFYLLKKIDNSKSNSSGNLSAASSASNKAEQNKSVQVISTNPDPLDGTIVQADQVIEITFSQPLENTGEFKHKLTPQTDYKLDLTNSRKTLRIIPNKPYELGNEFTLFIEPDTKFDNGARLDGEKIFHFKTVPFRGV